MCDFDLVGYEILIEFIERHNLYRLEGDILEIGSFLGGGTVKLAKLAMKHKRKIFTVDIFSPDSDITMNTEGYSMKDIYNFILQGKRQKDIFLKVIEGFDNITVICKDSREVAFSGDEKFFFTFIDGNHSSFYVWNDFKLAWNNTVSEGAVAFHDYRGDLPETTETINKITDTYREEISRTEENTEKKILFLFKK
ncbi:MAG: class I SAM-dependent methyltransferase [Candidatus Eremiobacterota bacterium]